MVSKKGEGVRGVLGGLVSRDRERLDQPTSPGPSVAPPSQPPGPDDASPPILPAAATSEEPLPPAASDPVARKATGIKGRPRTKKDKDAAPSAEKAKVTLSIETQLRDAFYLLAHGEMMQPGEFVERALRYWIKHHPKRG